MGRHKFIGRIISPNVRWGRWDVRGDPPHKSRSVGWPLHQWGEHDRAPERRSRPNRIVPIVSREHDQFSVIVWGAMGILAKQLLSGRELMLGTGLGGSVDHGRHHDRRESCVGRLDAREPGDSRSEGRFDFHNLVHPHCDECWQAEPKNHNCGHHCSG